MGGFLELENNRIMVPPRLSAAESTLAYYSLLVTIRKKYRMDTPLIIDSFGSRGLKYCPMIVQLLAETVPQTLIFTTEGNFGISMYNYRTRKEIPSIYKTVKEDTLGAVYRLDGKGVLKYVSF